MRFLLTLSSCSALFTAVAVATAVQPRPAKVSYDGYKVFRVSVGKDVARVKDVVSGLGLTTWKGAPRAGAFADVVVPPTQLAGFTKEVAGLDVRTMHEDLGASIAEESAFHAYAGMLPLSSRLSSCPSGQAGYSKAYHLSYVVQLDPPIQRGSIPTTHTVTTSSS